MPRRKGEAHGATAPTQTRGRPARQAANGATKAPRTPLASANAEPERARRDMRCGLYAAIFRRRDIRRFRPEPVPDATLGRILLAAHHAPSVGFTQPWSFVIVRDLERRLKVKRVFERERLKNAAKFRGARRARFLSFKLEGILEAPLNLIVTCQIGRFGPAVLGKPGIEQVELYSTCLAVQNLWLAARAEGLGVGWVSIISNDALRSIFSLPPKITPVAYLCLGYAERFSRRPTLEEAGWAPRLKLEQLLHFDSWGAPAGGSGRALARLARSAGNWRGIFPAGEMPAF